MDHNLRPDQIAAGTALYAAKDKAGGYLTDAQASTVPDLYAPWAKSRWRDYKLNAIVRHEGARLWKFNLPALVDESQNVEPGTNETIWTEIAYHNGVKIIPDVITAVKAFANNELGWWHGDPKAQQGVYKSKMDGNTHHPSVAAAWTFVQNEPVAAPEDDASAAEPDGSSDNPYPYPEEAGVLTNVVRDKYYSYKGLLYVALKNVTGCHWKPTDPGTYIWDEV